MMTIDEAIQHCKEKSCSNNACALEYKQLEEWLIELKNLRKNQWKPSEEQMEFLWKYAEQNNYDGSILTSLYNDLKKLIKL